MWPYNDCEWKTITYGAGAMKKRAEKKTRDRKILMVLSLLPTVLLISGLMALLK